MDLSSPLATVTPTFEAPVLQVLASTKSGCTAGEIHRRMGRGSQEGVRKALARLVATGLVHTERIGAAHVYTLNRQHLAADLVESLSRFRSTFLSRLAAEFDEWSPAPIHASLFGSFARGEAGPDSDIEVVLIHHPFPDTQSHDAWGDAIDGVSTKIAAWTGNTARIVDLEPQTLRRMVHDHDPLVESWRSDGVDVFGVPLRMMLKNMPCPREPKAS